MWTDLPNEEPISTNNLWRKKKDRDKYCVIIWGGTCILKRLDLYCGCRMSILAVWIFLVLLPAPTFDFGWDLTHLYENCDLAHILRFLCFFRLSVYGGVFDPADSTLVEGIDQPLRKPLRLRGKLEQPFRAFAAPGRARAAISSATASPSGLEQPF